MSAVATSRVRAGWLAVLAGLGLALAIQVAAPVGVPLYDGVVVQEPYRYLHPTGDQVGDPTAFAADPEITGGVSPTIVAATTESPPQAQLIAQRGALEIPTGATSLRVTITPIDPPAPPAEGTIAGNVYRIAITTDTGSAVEPKPCDGCISLVLRAPDGAGEATIQRFSGGTWTAIPTVHAGAVAMYSTNPTALGDFAVVGGAAVPPADGGPDLSLVVVGIAAGLIAIALVGLLLMRGRSSNSGPPVAARPGPSGRTGAAPMRVPSKRRRPRPPSEGDGS